MESMWWGSLLAVPCLIFDLAHQIGIMPDAIYQAMFLGSITQLVYALVASDVYEMLFDVKCEGEDMHNPPLCNWQRR